MLNKSKDLRKMFIKITFYKIYCNKIHILITVSTISNELRITEKFLAIIYLV